MVQREIDVVRDVLKLLEEGSKKSISTQTGEQELEEFQLSLSENKRARLYYSESYKDFVLSFNYTNCKKFIVTKPMWKVLRPYLNKIDSILSSD